MKRVSFFLGWIFLLIVAVSAQDKIVKLKIVETSDIHGNYYPYDFILRHEAGGSLARIHAFVQKEREVYKDNLLLLDNGIFCKASLVPIITIILTLFLRIWQLKC